MFLEPHFKGQRSGWIEVICGSMFSGKTEELIRRLKRAKIAGRIVEVFKPEIDTRYGKMQVVSHDDNSLRARPVSHAADILDHLGEAEIVGIDEAQFFDEEITELCQELANRGIRVIVAGLDMDYQGKPFGCIPDLLAVSEYITKVHAICNHCGSLATHSYRLTDESKQVIIGEKNQYEARCRKCFQMKNMLPLRS